MLLSSFSLLVVVALLGSALAVWYLRAHNAAAPGWLFGALHGLLGAVGLVVLLLALRGPPRGEAFGVAAFGRIAAVLLAMALTAGLMILAVKLRHRRVPSIVVGIHAVLAIGGIVVLAAYVLVG